MENKQEEMPIQGNMNQEWSTMTRIGETLLTVFAAIWCVFIIPMIWCIPFIVRQGKRKRGEMPISVGHIIISFLFINWIGALLVAIGGNVK